MSDFQAAITIQSDVDANSHKIVNLSDPVLSSDAATKDYVDTAISSANEITKISEIVVSDPTQIVTFSAIPTTYKDLKIVWQASAQREDGSGGSIMITFNSDSAANYPGHLLTASGTTSSSTDFQTLTGYTSIFGGNFPNSVVDTGYTGFGEMLIGNYVSTIFYKSFIAQAGMSGTSAGQSISASYQITACWKSYDAITQVDINCGPIALFATGSITA